MERSTGHLGTAIHSMRAGSTSKPPGPPPLSFHLAKNLCSSGPLVLVRRGMPLQNGGLQHQEETQEGLPVGRQRWTFSSDPDHQATSVSDTQQWRLFPIGGWWGG